MKIIIACANEQPGWAATTIETLNLLKEDDWQQFPYIEAIFAEHIWEHLTQAEAEIAAKMCYKYLVPGGYLRVAVPDGYHPDPHYIEYVRPGGSGAGADDHKMLYTYLTLKRIFTDVGFAVDLLEYWDEHGLFHRTSWDTADGFVRRSLRHDLRNEDGSPHYTSIILDAIRGHR